MSHIYRSDDDFLFINDMFKDIQKLGYCEAIIDEILDRFIPRNDNKPLVNYKILKTGMYSACFLPEYNSIDIAISKLLSWLDINSKELTEYFNIKDIELFRYYLLISVLTHEIEHSYQYLMSKELVESPCNYVKDGYKYLFELTMKKDYIIPRPITMTRRLISKILYQKHRDLLVLERGAQIESYDLLRSLAYYNGNEEMVSCFSNLKNTYLLAGYTGDNNGSFLETFKTILMMDKYKKLDTNYDLDEDTKLRYGLPVSEETKNKILKKI